MRNYEINPESIPPDLEPDEDITLYHCKCMEWTGHISQESDCFVDN